MSLKRIRISKWTGAVIYIWDVVEKSRQNQEDTDSEEEDTESEEDSNSQYEETEESREE